MGLVIEAAVGGLKVGDNYPVRIIGVINVSPESFYKQSIKVRREEIINEALEQLKEGASIIDIGGRSTAPYLKTDIPLEEEARRAVQAVKALREAGIKALISIDTTSSKVAEEAINAGADIVNDISGLKKDPEMLDVIKEYEVPAIIAAYPTKTVEELDPVKAVTEALSESLELAKLKDINIERLVIDPAIGFIRPKNMPWYIWDSTVIGRLTELRPLNRPILVGVSRKSFLGAITGKENPEDRLPASLAATAIAVCNGAHLIRTHDVKETKDAVRVAEFIKKLREHC